MGLRNSTRRLGGPGSKTRDLEIHLGKLAVFVVEGPLLQVDPQAGLDRLDGGVGKLFFRAFDPAPDSILNPFSVYRNGEALLRRQLMAFSVWHLVNIVRDYQLSDLSAATLNAMSAPELVELIVAAVRVRGHEVIER